MKVAVITDAHANLPALEAALAAIRREGCDAIYHTGDAIGIGPFPAECLGLLLATPNMHFIMGNHDAYFVDGLASVAATMSEGELAHQRWTHAQIEPALRNVLTHWPYETRRDFGDFVVTFVHYALDQSRRDFRPFAKPNAPDLDALFAPHDGALIFYGHNHPSSDIQGRARYVNPGSLGCFTEPVARYAVVEFSGAAYRLEHRGVGYDDTSLGIAFAQRRVPDREFICRAFLGGRFSF